MLIILARLLLLLLKTNFELISFNYYKIITWSGHYLSLKLINSIYYYRETIITTLVINYNHSFLIIITRLSNPATSYH